MDVWYQIRVLHDLRYKCGYCDAHVGPAQGFCFGDDRNPPRFMRDVLTIRVCSNCSFPSFFYGAADLQVPPPRFGNDVPNLPGTVKALYDEARACVTVNAYTASASMCRKLLMNVAVSKGAPEGKNFVFYVEWLSNQGYTTPQHKGWVDHIRKKGNEATHSAATSSQKDAEELITFCEMLLRVVYDFPTRSGQG